MKLGVYSIGVDLGGTNLRIAAYSPEDGLKDTIQLSTRRPEGRDAVLLDLCEAVESLTAIVIGERARRDGTPQDPETERMLKLADKCRQANATDRLYPVLSSFGLLDMHATPA